jgi:hypothetical protein
MAKLRLEVSFVDGRGNHSGAIPGQGKLRYIGNRAETRQAGGRRLNEYAQRRVSRLSSLARYHSPRPHRVPRADLPSPLVYSGDRGSPTRLAQTRLHSSFLRLSARFSMSHQLATANGTVPAIQSRMNTG